MLDSLINDLGGQKSNIYKNDWNYMVEKYYNKLWTLICDQKTVMLEPINLKISEKQLFYSKTDKKYLFLGPTWQMYLVSEKKDKKKYRSKKQYRKVWSPTWPVKNRKKIDFLIFYLWATTL